MRIAGPRQRRRNVCTLSMPGTVVKRGIAGAGFIVDETHHEMRNLRIHGGLQARLGKRETSPLRGMCVVRLDFEGRLQIGKHHTNFIVLPR